MRSSARSYIRTDGSTVTRLTDILSGASNPQFMTGTGNYLVFNANSNAFFAQELYSYNIDTRLPMLIPTGTGNDFFVGFLAFEVHELQRPCLFRDERCPDWPRAVGDRR